MGFRFIFPDLFFNGIALIKPVEAGLVKRGAVIFCQISSKSFWLTDDF
jgi:hypothetical protein